MHRLFGAACEPRRDEHVINTLKSGAVTDAGTDREQRRDSVRIRVRDPRERTRRRIELEDIDPRRIGAVAGDPEELVA